MPTFESSICSIISVFVKVAVLKRLFIVRPIFSVWCSLLLWLRQNACFRKKRDSIEADSQRQAVAPHLRKDPPRKMQQNNFMERLTIKFSDYVLKNKDTVRQNIANK